MNNENTEVGNMLVLHHRGSVRMRVMCVLIRICLASSRKSWKTCTQADDGDGEVLTLSGPRTLGFVTEIMLR